MNSLRDSLRRVVERPELSAGKAFALTTQALIVASIVSFSIETMPGLSRSTRTLLNHIEVAFVVLFTCEYLLRLWVSTRRTAFVFSFFGIVDLVAIVPFYLSSGLDLRSVRAFRLLRLFRVLKLVRYSPAIHRLREAMRATKDELVIFLVASVIVLYLAGVGIYYCERDAQPDAFQSIFDGLWWAVATLTTVGYGDIHPVTSGGKIFTFAILMVGLGVVAIPTGLVASALTEARRREGEHPRDR